MILKKQKMSAQVLFVDHFLDIPKTDALITQKSHLNLTVKTADCAPVLMADENAHLIAAIHAGWKSAFQGILEASVLQLVQKGALPKNIVVGIGPCLHQKSFRMGKEIYDLFPPTEKHFFKPTADNGFLFDFVSYIKARLNRIKIENIEVIDIDTYTTPSFYSYRRDPKNPARQFSSIQWID